VTTTIVTSLSHQHNATTANNQSHQEHEHEHSNSSRQGFFLDAALALLHLDPNDTYNLLPRPDTPLSDMSEHC
jgi:hypothetical protein